MSARDKSKAKELMFAPLTLWYLFVDCKLIFINPIGVANLLIYRVFATHTSILR